MRMRPALFERIEAAAARLSTEELERFVTAPAATPQRWQHLVRHSDDARVYEQIWDSEEVNAWVICWSEDQDTGFHDHDDSAAAILVIDGQVREERLRLGSTPRRAPADRGRRCSSRRPRSTACCMRATVRRSRFTPTPHR